MANPNLTKGNNYFRNEQYKEAIEAYSKIDKSSTSYPYALFNIGECYFQQGKFIEAIKYYSQSSDNHFSLYQSALFNCGSSFYNLDKYAEAIEMADKVDKSKISGIEESFNLMKYILEEETSFNILCLEQDTNFSILGENCDLMDMSE
ncbi:MAG: tol-pal system YbgF family protein [Rickettsia sp.]|uniref:tetratricopeptide repeat protein n=1 Tax=Rickettsia sp. TaxID=789 RepID=UPI003979B67F